MSWRKVDVWSKQLSDGQLVEYLFFTLFQSQGRKKSWAGAKVSGIALEPIHDLSSDLTRSQVATVEKDYGPNCKETVTCAWKIECK